MGDAEARAAGFASEREQILLAIAEDAVEALALADNYLDGFVWLTEPECSELEEIKAKSKHVQRLWDEVRGAVVPPGDGRTQGELGCEHEPATAPTNRRPS